MARHGREVPDWKEFEQLVARIEKDADPIGLTVTSPDRSYARSPAENEKLM